MDISSLSIPSFLIENLRREKIKELFPPQSEAIQKGVLERRNCVLATTTASGKTLIAVMCAAIHLQQGGKVLYLAPLRALASEKFDEFTRLLKGSPGGDPRIAITSGDYDSSDPWLENFQVIITTNEKMDSLLRHGARWIKDISLLVLDEIHLLGDRDRGPTLEVTTSKILQLVEKVQVLALSATIKNSDEIARWLGALGVKSDWRPVQLKEGVLHDWEVEFIDGERIPIQRRDPDPATSLALEIVERGGQTLIFATTRKKAEKLAERAALALQRSTGYLSSTEFALLSKYSRAIGEKGDRSSFTEKLGKLVATGAAFHHAGLARAHRNLIEEVFRTRALKIIAATPTLAAGVNLPARIVIIPELWRYDAEYGAYGISVMEYKQFCGRAGRPGYDKVGYAVPVARNEVEKAVLREKYIEGEPERIWSRLSDERHLRSHVLALVASGFVNSKSSLNNFFERTLFAEQYGMQGIAEKLENVVAFLVENNMLKTSGKQLSASELGKRVSELYIDPLSAVRLIEGLKASPSVLDEISILHLVSRTTDIPSIPMSRIPLEKLELYYERNKTSLLVTAPDPEIEPEEYETFLHDFKKVITLEAWVNEVSEGDIYERFRVEPGDLAVIREAGEWVTYSAHEIAKILRRRDKLPMLKNMTERVRHGIKEELISLVRLEGVGRVRARSLFRAGFKNVEAIARASVEDLVSVPNIGMRLAVDIKKQAGGKIGRKLLTKEAEETPEQTDLGKLWTGT